MKVLVTNATGSSKREASLSKDGGVVVFACGEVSHLQHLLSLNHKIYECKEAEKPKDVAPSEDKKADVPAGQSKKGKKEAVK